MKLSIIISAFLLCASLTARADALLHCKDAGGKDVFKGYVGSEMSPISEKITREVEIPYEFAVAAKPAMGLDRATFRRGTGIDLKKCEGPYVHVYEKLEDGKFRCAGGSIQEVDGEMAEDEEVLTALGQPKAEIACSAILEKGRLPGNR